MKLGAWAYPSTVTAERYDGQGPFGPVYAAPTDIRCTIDATVKLVRDSAGREVVSQATLLCPDDVDLPAESRVTLQGRTATVISTSLPDAPLGGIRQRIVTVS